MNDCKKIDSMAGGRRKRLPAILILMACFVLGSVVLNIFASAAFAQTKVPTLSIDLNETNQVDDIVPAIKVVSLLTILSIAPAILLMMTSFTRILVVLSFVRQALGTQTMPPNQVIVGLAMFLTLFTMTPVLDVVKEKAFDPYVEKKISQEEAIEEFLKPVRKFMLAQTRETDLGLFYNISKKVKPEVAEDIPISILVPAFMVSELKTAFQIGFLIYIPFLIIDMVISSTLMAMGMMMLPPTVVSLPFKLVLFVLVDGWALIVGKIVESFNV
jgi:flagellar biosynthetic protein FliP